MAEFEKQYLQLLEAKHADDVMAKLAQGILDEDISTKLTAAAKEVANRF